MNGLSSILGLLVRVASHHLVQKHLRNLAREAGKQLIHEAIRYHGERFSKERSHRV